MNGVGRTFCETFCIILKIFRPNHGNDYQHVHTKIVQMENLLHYRVSEQNEILKPLWSFKCHYFYKIFWKIALKNESCEIVGVEKNDLAPKYILEAMTR